MVQEQNALKLVQWGKTTKKAKMLIYVTNIYKIYTKCQFLLQRIVYNNKRTIMSSYNYDSIVSKTEADALKDMIFNRVRERAEALNEETQNSYTTNVRADVMDLARESFTASKNPFSLKAEKEEEPASKQTEPDKVRHAREHAEEIRAQIDYRTKLASENIANDAAREAMNEARDSLSKKSSFLGALDFLNEQATISLISKKGSVFDAIA